MAICLTEFHMLILYDDRVKAICTLNEQVVYEDVFPTRLMLPSILTKWALLQFVVCQVYAYPWIIER